MKKLEQMTLQEKVGQLLMVGFIGTDEVPEGMARLVSEYNFSGAIYFSRNAKSIEQMANLSQSLQNLAKQSSAGIPLFISIDQEGGIVSRMPAAATIFPGNMALGAINDPEITYQMGQVVARELKSIGVNINLAPVLDVNNNAANPVIGVRSYGEDPEMVSRLGQAYLKGLQAEGILACGKHFPGHGDTAFDSHLDLASVPHEEERLRQIELKPFKDAIDAGLGSIMSAHVIFPAFEPEVGIPGTLSRKVLTDLLRNELKFDGLVLTDCMEMKAIADNFGTAEAAIRAVEAGADLVLVSHTYEKQLASYQGILQAVESGRISETRINESVTRILYWKEKLGLEKWIKDSAELQKVGCQEHKALAGVIGEKAVTLVKDTAGLLPAYPEKFKKVVLVYPIVQMLTMVEEKDAGPREAMHQAFKTIYPEIELVSISMNPTEAEFMEIQNKAAQADLMIFAAFFAAKNPAQARLINDLAKAGVKMVVVAVRNPYDLRVLPYVQVYLTTYDYNEYSLNGVAQVIAGTIEPQGELPITITGGAV